MTTMQLCVYIKDFAPFLCEAIWLAAVAAHAILIIWFSKNFMLNLELKNVFQPSSLRMSVSSSLQLPPPLSDISH